MLSGEATAKWHGHGCVSGERRPVEFDSIPISCCDMMGVAEVGGQCQQMQQQRSEKITHSSWHEPAMQYIYHHRQLAH